MSSDDLTRDTAADQPVNLTVCVPSRAADDPRLEPGTQLGRYVIGHRLGVGGMGAVYAARDPALDRTVAVKVLRGALDPRLDLRLRREAVAMARLQHPNVVVVHDVGEVGGRTYIAMEYVAGDTMAHWLAEPRQQAEILDAFRAAGRGLAAAHAAGVIHRDFKPENVLLGDDGRFRVSDFGLARAEAADAGESMPMAAADAGESMPMPTDAESATSIAEAAEVDDAATSILAGAADADESATSIREANEPATAIRGVGSSAEPATSSPAGGSVDVFARSAHPTLTIPGTVMGTPHYMAPELYDGTPADARSDQYSFCVALFTGLCRQRPSVSEPGGDPSGPLRGPAPWARVPRRIRAAIERGLAAEPADRFASLDELLAELAPPSTRRRKIAAAGVALVAAIAGGAAFAHASATAADPRCSGATAAFAPAWNPVRRAGLTARFTASGAPYAAAALDRVTTALDGYASRWARIHTDACEATRIRGEQTEAMLDLRMTCLARRRAEASALVETLVTADAAAVEHAATAATGLPDLAACSDVVALAQPVPPPADLATRTQLAAWAPVLAEARARRETGAFDAALARIRPVAEAARRLGYRPFEAEVALEQGLTESAAGDAKAARASLEAAVWAAEAGRADEIAARAWPRLIFLVGYIGAEPARAADLVPRATAALARISGDAAHDVESNLERALGAVDAGRGQLETAVGHFERAVALATQLPEAGPGLASALDNLGIAELHRGHAARAVELGERVVALQTALVGPDHPQTAVALHNLGNAHGEAGDHARAEAELRRSLAISEVVLGPAHPDVASLLSDLARELHHQGKDADAVAFDRRALAVGERAFGATDPAFALQLVDASLDFTYAHAFAEADAAIQRAEAIYRATGGEGEPDFLGALAVEGELRIREARWRDGLAIYQRLLPAVDHALAAGDNGQLRNAQASGLINMGLAHVELHQPALALPMLEPLATRRAQLAPDERVAAEFVLARALWDAGRDRARARQLAGDALAEARGLPSERREDLAELERWVAGHAGR